MATYQPPTEDLIAFNSSVFKTANETTLTLSEAQALFLGRTGNPTSTATTTTFNGTLSTISPFNVSNYLLSVAGDSVGLSKSVVANIRATQFGSGAAAGNDGVGFGYQAIGGGTSCLAFGRSATTGAIASNSANNCCAIGGSSSTAININYQTAIGGGTSCSAVQSTAIGYGASATVANSIVLGTATEFVSCPGTSANGSLITAADIFVNGIRAGVGNFQTDTNTCFGKDGLNATNSLGINNSAFGNSALKSQTGNSNCSAFGSGALATTTTEGNSGFGALAGNAISTGIKNTAVGSACLKFLTTGNRNTGVGNATGQLLTTGTENTLLGYLTGGNITGGSQNTFVGSSVTSGSTVTSSTALGAFSGVAGFSNSTAIGGGTSAGVPGAICSAAYQIMLGRATETVECPGTVSSISLKTASNISVNGACFGVGSGVTNSLFSGLTVGTGQGANNTLYGRGSYSSAQDGSSSGNTIIGAGSSNPVYGIMSNHTVVGYGAGGSASVIGQDNITCIGAGATVINSVANSTAIGYNAQATLANQIMLGRSTEFVECPGTDTTNGCLKLNGGLKLQTSYGAVPSATMLGYRIELSAIAISALTSNTSITIGSLALTVGVWSLNYTFELLSTGATSTTQQAFFFSDQSGSAAAYSTRIDNTGTTRFHSTIAYTNNDRPAFSGGGTYYASSAITLYPALNITFSTGALTGTGYASATRIG